MTCWFFVVPKLGWRDAIFPQLFSVQEIAPVSGEVVRLKSTWWLPLRFRFPEAVKTPAARLNGSQIKPWKSTQKRRVFSSCSTQHSQTWRLSTWHILSKALSLMVTDSGILIFVKELQPRKAWVPMAVTESGIVMLAKDSHPSKVPFSMDVTDSGIVMLAKDLQSRKASRPMVVIDAGMVMLSKDLQSWKAPLSMTVTDSGIVILVKELHPRKAPPAMAVTEYGIVILVKDLQF